MYNLLLTTLILVITAACTNLPDMAPPLRLLQLENLEDMIVLDGDYAPDHDIIRQKFTAMMDCAETNPDEIWGTFIIRISGPAWTSFPCSDGKFCTGLYIPPDMDAKPPRPAIIYVTEELYAFAHELGHHLDWIYNEDRYKRSNYAERHMVNMAATCGDIIDGDKVVKPIKVWVGNRPAITRIQ